MWPESFMACLHISKSQCSRFTFQHMLTCRKIWHTISPVSVISTLRCWHWGFHPWRHPATAVFKTQACVQHTKKIVSHLNPDSHWCQYWNASSCSCDQQHTCMYVSRSCTLNHWVHNWLCKHSWCKDTVSLACTSPAQITNLGVMYIWLIARRITYLQKHESLAVKQFGSHWQTHNTCKWCSIEISMPHSCGLCTDVYGDWGKRLGI